MLIKEIPETDKSIMRALIMEVLTSLSRRIIQQKVLHHFAIF